MKPARCAAFPAMAMTAPNPASRASREKAATASGVRCADITRTTKGTASFFRTSAALSAMGRSLSLPMTMAILFIVFSPSLRKNKAHDLTPIIT